MFQIQRIGYLITTVLGIIGILASVFFMYHSYNTAHSDALQAAEDNGMQLIQRSAQMFMVSTKKFHEEFNAQTTDVEKSRVKADWNRTIRAVDQAVINDFGEGQSRVRLLGDTNIVGIMPLGGSDTAIKTAFETQLMKDFASGNWQPHISRNAENTKLRIGVPLTSNMHPGCAQCHNLPVTDKTLLGGLVTYIPIEKSLKQAEDEAIINGLATASIFFCALVIIYFLIHTRVLKPLEQVRVATKELASGTADLSYRIDYDRNDEIGAVTTNLNQFIAKLHDVFKNINSTVLTLTESASKSSVASEKTAIIVEDQKVETTLVTESVDTLDNMAKQMSNQSSELVNKVGSARSDANSSVLQVKDAVITLENLASTLDGAKVTIEQLETDSKNIGGILDVIRSIADQTNLLALNAAIEAARAGEQGRGFAVVADEVRTLAKRTQESIEQIQVTIESLQKASIEVVKIVEVGQSSGEDTVIKAREASESLNSVLHGLDHLIEQNQQVSDVADEQSNIVTGIVNSVHKINLLGEQTVEQANDSKVVGSELKEVSSKLKELTGLFKL